MFVCIYQPSFNSVEKQNKQNRGTKYEANGSGKADTAELVKKFLIYFLEPDNVFRRKFCSMYLVSLCVCVCSVLVFILIEFWSFFFLSLRVYLLVCMRVCLIRSLVFMVTTIHSTISTLDTLLLKVAFDHLNF